MSQPLLLADRPGWRATDSVVVRNVAVVPFVSHAVVLGV